LDQVINSVVFCFDLGAGSSHARQQVRVDRHERMGGTGSFGGQGGQFLHNAPFTSADDGDGCTGQGQTFCDSMADARGASHHDGRLARQGDLFVGCFYCTQRSHGGMVVIENYGKEDGTGKEEQVSEHAI
jgi:hypothetical protein